LDLGDWIVRVHSHAYTGRDVYRMLVLERGWSSDEYESWLAATLIKALMG